MERLALKDLPQNRSIATGQGLTQAEASNFMEGTNQKVSIYPQHDIDSLFRNVVSW